MKRIIAMVLACALTLTACGQAATTSSSTNESSAETTTTSAVEESTETSEIAASEQETEDVSETTSSVEVAPLQYEKIVPEYTGMDDPKLLRYVEDNIYSGLVTDLNDDNYFIENVSAVYVSKEYLEELAFNSQSNVFFGYSLADLDAEFEGTRYVFTLGEDGSTVVQAFEDYDDTYEQVIKNVAIGTGVILICVTVSVATAGAGAPAVSMIFAAAAKTGTKFALSSGTISMAASSIVTGIQTGDTEAALRAGALAGSESFKWGAITGCISGGATEGVKYAKAMEALKGVTLNGITTQEAAAMQMESGFPIDVIKQFHSVDEYNVYKNAGLDAEMINGQLALVRDIDLTYESTMSDGKVLTNLQRMQKGLAPLDPATGKQYQLHHIGQKADATLAVLTEAEHQGNSKILNVIGKESEIYRPAFDTVRRSFWKSFAASVR